MLTKTWHYVKSSGALASGSANLSKWLPRGWALGIKTTIKNAETRWRNAVGSLWRTSDRWQNVLKGAGIHLEFTSKDTFSERYVTQRISGEMMEFSVEFHFLIVNLVSDVPHWCLREVNTVKRSAGVIYCNQNQGWVMTHKTIRQLSHVPHIAIVMRPVQEQNTVIGAWTPACVRSYN